MVGSIPLGRVWGFACWIGRRVMAFWFLAAEADRIVWMDWDDAGGHRSE